MKDFGVSLLILVVGAGGFALGRASDHMQEEVRIPVHESGEMGARVVEGDIPHVQGESAVSSAALIQGAPHTPGSPPVGGYVGSKHGTKYHLPWCSGALRIKDENKVWFTTKEEAEAAGYTPASNCKGI